MKEWAVIGKFITNRNGKQCRERWRNHLRPQLNKSEWSVEEDVQIWSRTVMYHVLHALCCITLYGTTRCDPHWGEGGVSPLDGAGRYLRV